MGYLIINDTNQKLGDMGRIGNLSSATYAFQVYGDGGKVEFSGSNIPNSDINQDDQWIPIATIENGVRDASDVRTLAWGAIRYKVISGNNVSIYVNVGAGS